LETRVVLTGQVVWEYPDTPEQACDFLSLLAAIRNYLPDDRYLLTASLPVAVLENINVQYAAQYLDSLNLVAYDFFGHWSKKSGHHSQLYSMNKGELSVDAGVKFLLSQGVPGKKILLGIPLFGHSFLNVKGPGHKNRGMGGNGGFFEYSQLPRKGTKERVDKQAMAAYCVGGDGGFVTYDNPDTVREKALYCKQKGLGVRIYPNHLRRSVPILTRLDIGHVLLGCPFRCQGL
jgi:chitinase